jgi:phosphoglycerol transferase MdoB-like AlkP superfamily enzyme
MIYTPVLVVMLFLGIALLIGAPFYGIRHTRKKGEPWTAGRKWSLFAILVGLVLALVALWFIVTGSEA